MCRPNAAWRLALALAASVLASCAHAEPRPIRIGVLSDLSGYSMEIGGPGSVLAARMAVEDHHGMAGGRPVEIVSADMQNKPDIAVQIARRWFDVENVDAIVDLPNTPVALAVAALGKQTNRLVFVTEAASTDLTGAQCAATTIHFADDTHAVAAGTARALVELGLKDWFFLTADFGFGRSMQSEAAKVVTSLGGTVRGTVFHPLAASDFSSFLLQAQQSGAQIVALASVAADTINAIKQADEFGLTKAGQKIAGLLMVVSDIKALGLDLAQGLYVTESFYWDQNDSARAFAARFAARDGGKVPTKAHAATYAAVRHYLDGIDKANTTDASAVKAAMQTLPIDFFGHMATLRSDGRVVYDLTLFQVKTPQDSKAPYDFYKTLRTIPASEAFLPRGAGGCGL